MNTFKTFFLKLLIGMMFCCPLEGFAMLDGDFLGGWVAIKLNDDTEFSQQPALAVGQRRLPLERAIAHVNRMEWFYDSGPFNAHAKRYLHSMGGPLLLKLIKAFKGWGVMAMRDEDKVGFLLSVLNEAAVD